MKRILFSLFVAIFALGLGSTAHAMSHQYYDNIFRLENSKGKFQNVYRADGSSANRQNDNFYKDGGGMDLYYHGNTDAGYVRWEKGNQQRPQDEWKASTDNVYHVGYFDIYNWKGQVANPIKGGTFEYSVNAVDVTNSQNKNPLSAVVDFYYWDNADATGGSWLVFTDLAFSMGTATYNGVEFEMFLELKVYGNNEEAGYTKFEGDLYNGAMDYFGFDPGTNLFAFYIPDGYAAYVAFNLAGYTNNPYAGNQVPLPGAVWLMGTGIAGLMVLRRRAKK